MTDEEILTKHSTCDPKVCSVDAPTNEWATLAKECKRADALKASAVTDLAAALKASLGWPTTKREKEKR